MRGDRGRLHNAGDVDRLINHFTRRRRCQQHPATGGRYLAIILDKGLQGGAICIRQRAGHLIPRLKPDQPIAIEVQGKAVTCPQRNTAEICLDQAGVAHMRRHKGCHAGIPDTDIAFIDNRGIRPAAPIEPQLTTAHELRCVKVVGCGHQPGGIHGRALAEQDTVLVDQNNLAIGPEAAHDG